MSNPYLKKRGDSPPPKTSFQRELDQTMRERSKRGLAADVSPQDSDDDGIEDDNELLGDFAATTKPKMSYLRNADPLMMTMKEPFKPSASRRIASPPLSNSKGQKLGSMGEEDEDLSEDSDDEPRKPRPSFLRNQPSKQPVLQRPKSPSIHGRKKMSTDYDEVDYTKFPRKRSVTPSAELEERKTASGRSTPRSTKSPSISRKPSEDNLSKIFSSERRTPTEGRTSPFNNRTSPYGDREIHDDSRKVPSNGYKSPKPHEEITRRTPVDGYKSPKLIGDNRRTPVDGYKSPKLIGDNRRTPVDGYKSPKLIGDNRRTPVDGYKSPKLNGDGRKTPVKNHKVPELFDEGHRTPTKDRKSPGPHLLQKKSSVLDFLEESSSAARPGHASSDDEELRRVAESQKKRNSSTPEFISVRIDGTTRKDESLNNKVNRHLSDNENTAFEEKLEEPVHKKEANTPATATNKAKLKTVRIQRTGKKAADEAIEVLTDAQNGTNKMKYIDPVKNEAFKSQSTVRKRSASSSRILKPKAVYSSSGTLSCASGSSTEALNFDCTKDIRQVVYEVWKVQATERMKLTVKEKKEKERELEEKKKKEKEEKILESVTTYKAWMDTKKGFVSTKTIQAKQEEEKKKEEELKKKQKKKEAEELFINWKKTQDVILKEKYREKLKAMKREERNKEEAKSEKQREAESAFRKWNQNKDDHLKNLKKEELRRARERKEHEERERHEQQKSAREQYEKWLEKKERQDSATQRKKQFDSDEEDGRRPWRPSSMKINHIR